MYKAMNQGGHNMMMPKAGFITQSLLPKTHLVGIVWTSSHPWHSTKLTLPMFNIWGAQDNLLALAGVDVKAKEAGNHIVIRTMLTCKLVQKHVGREMCAIINTAKPNRIEMKRPRSLEALHVWALALMKSILEVQLSLYCNPWCRKMRFRPRSR